MSAAPEPNEPPTGRPYQSARRRQQAAENRDLILSAAGGLFAERGWPGTGMRDIAAEAGVAVETVYANFRSKADLLLAAIDAAVAGDTKEVPLAARSEFLSLAEGDFPTRVVAAARLSSQINRRTAGLQRALAHAADSDSALADRRREHEGRRRISVEQGAEMVAGRPVTERERDGLWAVLGSEVYLLLNEISGWGVEQYEAWLADTILRLLDERPLTPPPSSKKGRPA